MNNKEKEQYLYEVYQYTVNFDFSKLNKYKEADDALCISDLILDYRMLFELNQEITKKLQKENKRLNNIINKLEKDIKDKLKEYNRQKYLKNPVKSKIAEFKEEAFDYMLYKLKELKGEE